MDDTWEGRYGPRLRRGFDLDGVIASERGWLFWLARLIPIPVLVRHCQRNAKCLQRPIVGVIITCRRESQRRLTHEWCSKNYFKRPIFFCADVAAKAAKINELELTHYYENDCRVAAKLTVLCPGTAIILAGEVRA